MGEQTMQQDEITKNLQHLCGLFPSIAEVCRRMKINRQQFNKYLNGQVRPSRHNLRIICDFFGITEAEIHTDSSRFREIVSPKRRSVIGSAFDEPLRHIESLYKCSASLERYVGFYFRYYYSFSYPGYVAKSLAHISEKDGRYYWNNLENMRPGRSRKSPTTSNYKGALFFLADRIFVIEYHSQLRNSITELILYPNYKNTRILHLIGIQTGAASTGGRKPAASRVLLEYIGKDIHVKDALRSAGLFHEDSSVLDPTIRDLVRNRIPEGSYTLAVDEV
jgi:transcriptional regulator with XRE-family HTH domain